MSAVDKPPTCALGGQQEGPGELYSGVPYARLVPPSLFAYLTALTALAPSRADAQFELDRVTAFPWKFIRGGTEQTLAGLGGLNSPQVSLADIDGDGVDDLYLFDRDGDVHLALRRDGGRPAGEWVYAPELTSGWPAVISFAALRDFDADGVPDLFAISSAPGQSALEVYRGTRRSGGLSFERVAFPAVPADVLYTVDGAQVYVAITDVPAIEDVDGDGDLDVLSFESAGTYVRFFENVSEAQPGDEPADFLRFRQASSCYGGVYESAFDGSVLLAEAPGACAEPSDGLIGPRHGALHPGSTLALADVDGDGDEDLLVGDIASESVVALLNAPPADGQAFFTEVELGWPAAPAVPPVALPFFPTVYPLPLAGPVEEYLVSPSNPGGGADYACLWRYTVSAGGTLALDRRDYLTHLALDHGTGAHAALGDLTGDGIDDILIGNTQAYNDGDPISTLTLYAYDASEGGYVERAPTWLAPINALVASSLQRPTPTLADLDADGDLDLFLGSALGTVSFAENLAGAAAPADFADLVPQWAGIDVGSFSAPALADVSGDGTPDLLVGDRAGRLNFFPNRGSAGAPAFDAEPVETSFGQIDVRLPGFPSPNLRPAFVQLDGRAVLYLGTADGRLFAYDDLPLEPGGSAQLVAELELGVGGDLDPAFGLDPEGEPFAVVGNARGGIGLFRPRGTSSLTQVEPRPGSAWRVAPNPTPGPFQLDGLPRGATVEIVDALGRLLFRGSAEDVPAALPTGTFVIRSLGQARLLIVR